ncbi:MAG: PorT family protein [Gemmatimonadota bacterium]|nr:PorT family protein [Gemmatimonadota bacterium]
MTRIRQFFSALAFAGLLVPAGLAAQSNSLIGVKAGINSSTVSFSDGDEVDAMSATGFVGGLFAQIGLGEMFAIQPEGLYSSKGFKADIDGEGAQLRVNYIEIPVLLVARFGDAGGVRPSVFAGPVISFESKCELKSTGSVAFKSDCPDVPDEPIETKSTDFGAAFGAGILVPLGGVSLVADARYTLGLTNLTDDDESAKNRAWSFMGGVAVGIG